MNKQNSIKRRKHCLKITKKVLKKNRARKAWEKQRNRQRNCGKKKWRERKHRPNKTIFVPENLSLFSNAANTQEFVEVVAKTIRMNQNILIDFRDSKNFSIEAIVLLRATLHEARKIKEITCIIKGPLDPTVHKILEQTGFYDEWIPIGNSSIPPSIKSGIILKEDGGIKMDPKTCQKICKESQQILPNVKPHTLRMLYRILGEMMGNTANHAHKNKEGVVSWWLAAYHFKESKTIRFAFYDAGIGVIQSIKEKIRTKPTHQLYLKTDEDLLKAAFAGEQITEKFRGKGFPTIIRQAKENIIQNLRIITNKFKSRPCEGTNQELNKPLKGTLLCWEIKE